jgi:glc operon protein GlcG
MRSRQVLTGTDVHKMVAACRAEAEKNKWNVSIAVVDEGGFLLHLDRLDGAGAVAAEVAAAKARTSAITKRPTKAWEDMVKDRPVFLKFPDSLPIQGGVPILHQGDCLGAIGVSGVQSHQDEQIATAGIAALG